MKTLKSILLIAVATAALCGNASAMRNKYISIYDIDYNQSSKKLFYLRGYEAYSVIIDKNEKPIAAYIYDKYKRRNFITLCSEDRKKIKKINARTQGVEIEEKIEKILKVTKEKSPTKYYIKYKIGNYEEISLRNFNNLLALFNALEMHSKIEHTCYIEEEKEEEEEEEKLDGYIEEEHTNTKNIDLRDNEIEKTLCLVVEKIQRNRYFAKTKKGKFKVISKTQFEKLKYRFLINGQSEKIEYKILYK